MSEWVAANPAVARVAEVSSAPAYLVGGVVRDLVRGADPGPDVDIVVEGPVDKLARRLASDLSADVVVHERFLTAEVIRMDGACLDLVTARTERYPTPGSLPEVAPAGLAEDLARRDFTVNAIAFGLCGPSAGALVDPHGGVADVRDRVVRILRPDAFVEDPSRLVRAARYAARLDAVLAPDTAAAAREASAGLDPASARVADELERLLREATAAASLTLLASLGVPWLSTLPDRQTLSERFDAIDRAVAHPAAPSVGAWPLRLGLAVDPSTVERMSLTAAERDAARGARAGIELADDLRSLSAPSDVDRLLGPAHPSAQVSALAHGAEVVRRWWVEWRDRTLRIDGGDLAAAGLAEGPAVGRALAAVRTALLDGSLSDDREEQVAFALAAVR